MKYVDIIGKRLERLSALMFSNQFPGRIDDVFLNLDQLIGVAASGGRALSRLRRPFADNLFKETDLGKEHVARGAPDFALAIKVLGPEVISDQVALFRVKRFHIDESAERVGLVAGQSDIV